MNFSGDSVNVYAEAKTEYTRQLCQNLTPSIQIYFLDLFKLAKEKDSDTRRMLWNFQTLIQEIPDWSQDKVLRETEKIQRDSNCDYLEELLTAVFIAHTKVLSAIRITTKQKKLQLTIPKIDHFLHRTLRETGRLLWGNAFLFAEQGTPIERQKNMRQIETLIQEGIQQSIRSLLPVKAILREYLNDEADDVEEETGEPSEKEGGVSKEEKEDEVEIKQKNVEETPLTPMELVVAPPPTPAADTVEIPSNPLPGSKSIVNIIKETASVVNDSINGPINEVITPTEPIQTSQTPVTTGPTLFIQTEPSVSFTNMDTVFDSDHPEQNEITQVNHSEQEDIDHVDVLNLPPEPMDEFEDLESTGAGIEFEEIA